MPLKYVSEITASDVAALHRFAREHGRRWKQALRDEWMRACSRVPMYVGSVEGGAEYRGVLQRLRNRADFGTRGLAAFKLPSNFSFHSEEQPECGQIWQRRRPRGGLVALAVVHHVSESRVTYQYLIGDPRSQATEMTRDRTARTEVSRKVFLKMFYYARAGHISTRER